MRLFSALVLSAVCLMPLSVRASLPVGNDLPQGVAVGSAGFDDLLAKQLGTDSLNTSAMPDGSFQLTNNVQALSAQVTASGVSFDSIGSSAGKGGFALSLSQWGREGVLRSAESSSIYRDGDAVFHAHKGGIAEKFSNTGNGIQQDFIVPVKPLGNGALQVQLAVKGATLNITNNGVTVALNTSPRTLTYNRLKVTDAKGNAIPASMQLLADNQINIVVNDSTAQYPLTIDPTVGDANWISMAGLQGVSNTIHSITRHGTDIYVGGSFLAAGNTPANHIAKWNGSSWSALGDGLDGDVLALAIDDEENLYAGGEFTISGNLIVSHIAKWNGGNWTALSAGTNDSVDALVIDSKGELYVGGRFTDAGAAGGASHVAKWDGNSWHRVGFTGGGLSGRVMALAADANGNVYAGGAFVDLAHKYIAKWDGVGTEWSALGSSVNGEVTALVTDSSGNLYAGGAFTTADGSPASRIAKWNGSNWSAMGSGVNNNVVALNIDGNGQLYAAGVFTTAGGVTANGVAQWDGSSWSALGSGVVLGSRIYALLTDSNNYLFAGGRFDTINGVMAKNTALWNGSNWSAIGAGMNGEVKALAADGAGNLYAGGIFTTAEGVVVNHIAKWNGSSWSALGSGMNDVVNSLVIDGSGNLYAGGKFTSAGGVAASSIAKWNGSSWSALGAGITDCYNYSNCVHSLVMDSNGNLYAGGGFTTAGGVTVNSVAKWNGSAWSALGTGVLLCSSFPCVNGLAIDSGNNLYAAGSFDVAGGISVFKIAKWDGSVWSGLGGGMGSAIYAVAVDSAGNVYAGGQFGGAGSNRIGKWDGSTWSPLGSGYVDNNYSLVFDGNGNLYAGGYSSTVGWVSAKNIGKWDGSTWSELGSGLDGCFIDPCVSALVIDSSGNLYAGGDFTLAGKKVSAFTAKWLLVDADNDGIGDQVDAFPADPAESVDTDQDGTGDVADTDDDGDGVSDVSDNCSLVINGSQIDTDLDGIGDACDTDDDNDSVLDAGDNCVLISNSNQLDWDKDGIADVCDDPSPVSDFAGIVTKDQSGSSVAFAGDVNGDGYGDYVVGIPGYDVPATPTTKLLIDAGRAVVISGKNGSVLMSVNGVAAKDAMGKTVAGGVDFDHDGFADVVVGAPLADYIGGAVKDSGSVTVVYGPNGVRTQPLFGAQAKSAYGSAIALADTNDDGYADIIVGAPKEDNVASKLVDAGSVRVINGSDFQLAQTFYGAIAKAYAGTSVAAGKVDAINGADIVIGAPNDDDLTNKLVDAGSVTVYNIAGTELLKKYGAVAKAYLGKSVSAGDVNKDGRDDVLVGAPGDDNGLLKDVGSATVFSGVDGTQLTKKYGALAKAGLGNSVATGDVNNDGFADIIAGASKDDKPTLPKVTLDTGSVTAWNGATYAVLITFYGDATKDYLGSAVAAGDVNNDGKADLLMGMPGKDITAAKPINDAGAVKLISGSTL